MTIQRASILEQPAHYLEGADFQIIVPEESTNLIANPSFETSTANWTAAGTGVTLTRDTAESFYGASSGRMSDASATGANEYIQTEILGLNPNTSYTLSFNYKKRVTGAWTGTVYVSYYNGLTPISSAAFVLARGSVSQWKRASFTSLSPAGTTRALLIFSTDGVLSGAFDLWLDGVQFEAKPYATTYIDGEQDDCVWIGAPHGSSSYRLATTRKGGRPMKLSDYKFRVISVVGAGAAALTTVATPYANIGGGYYQRSVAQSRTLQIVGAFECRSQIDLMRSRAALIDAVNPNRTSNPQPARLLYTPIGCSADEPTKQVVIDGVYAGGLEGNQTNEVGSERAVLAFNVYLPFAAIGSGEGDRSISLALNRALSSPSGIVARNRLTGAVDTMSGGSSPSPIVARVVMGTDGLPYVIGYFTSIGGVSANYVAKWTGSTFAALGSGLATINSSMPSAVDASNRLYVGISSSITSAYITYWNGSTWTTLATFTHGSDVRLDSIAVAPNGNIYVAGQFTSAGGTAITNIAMWNGISWTAVGSAPNDRVRSLAFDKAGNLYAGGQFTVIGGVSAYRIAKFNGSAWSALGAGMTKTSGTCVVTTLYVARDGRLYAYGDFDTADGISAMNIAAWNGAGWTPLGAGLNKSVAGYEGTIYEDDSRGIVVAGFYTVNGSPSMQWLARWTGSSWIHGPVYFVTGSGNYLNGALIAGMNELIYGSFNAMTVPAVVKITTDTQTNNLKFVFTGPGAVISVKNYTSGDELLFNLALADGEVATLTLGSTFSFVSTFRGDIAGTILGNSNVVKFRLLAGENSVALFMLNTTGSSAATLTYKEMYQSLDNAVR